MQTVIVTVVPCRQPNKQNQYPYQFSAYEHEDGTLLVPSMIGDLEFDSRQHLASSFGSQLVQFTDTGCHDPN